jgi:Mg2+ and Co2+ transporter CorA
MVKAIYLENNMARSESAELFRYDENKQYLWLDFIDPAEAELQLLHRRYHITTPLVDEIDEVDLYNIKKYPDYYVFHLSYITHEDGNHELKNVACYLCIERVLVTIRSVRLDSFETVHFHILNSKEPFTDGYLISALLFAERIDFDTLEMKRMIVRISELTNKIGIKKELTAKRLDEINNHITYMLLIRLVMMNQQLTLNSIQKLQEIKDETRLMVTEMQQDIKHAIDYADFNTNRLDFMMTSFVAYLNIQQNSYMYMFTYITILLSPALLVVGFYGMNVIGLPVAEKSYGVWFAFGLMVIGILISYLVIRFIKPRAV